MKGSMSSTRRMEMEFLLGRVVMYTKVITKMMKEMDMVKCSGLMDLGIKESGKRASNMEMVR
jgi:hypothetical protein